MLNDSAGVLIEVEGDQEKVAELCRLLRESAPPLARVTSRRVGHAARGPVVTTDFRIVESAAGTVPNVDVSVDSATCDDCLGEVDDPA